MQWWLVSRQARRGIKAVSLSAQVPAHTEAQAVAQADRIWMGCGEDLSRYRPANARRLTEEEIAAVAA